MTDWWQKAIEDANASPTEVNGVQVKVPPIPDFTPDGEQMCEAKSRSGFVCTMRPHHEGLHVAGDGDQVVAIWF